jgi:hypothetical protein
LHCYSFCFQKVLAGESASKLLEKGWGEKIVDEGDGNYRVPAEFDDGELNVIFLPELKQNTITVINDEKRSHEIISAGSSQTHCTFPGNW